MHVAAPPPGLKVKACSVQEERIRVAVIDGHGIFAEALASRLTDEPDLEVVGTAVTPDEALDLFSQNEIDVVTLGLGLAGRDWLALICQLQALRPELGIVAVITDTDDPRGIEAVQQGVRGWVAMQSGVESLLTAIRGVARGEIHLPIALMTRVLTAFMSEEGRASEWARTGTPESELIAPLTGRELDVLRRSQGWSRPLWGRGVNSPDDAPRLIEGLSGETLSTCLPSLCEPGGHELLRRRWLLTAG